MRRPFIPIPGQYSFWVHFFMATAVAGTMILVGAYITWRVEKTQATLRDVKAHLRQHDILGAELVHQQQQILDRLR